MCVSVETTGWSSYFMSIYDFIKNLFKKWSLFYEDSIKDSCRSCCQDKHDSKKVYMRIKVNSWFKFSFFILLFDIKFQLYKRRLLTKKKMFGGFLNKRWNLTFKWIQCREYKFIPGRQRVKNCKNFRSHWDKKNTNNSNNNDINTYYLNSTESTNFWNISVSK